MAKKKITVDGMTCGHCKMHVEEALNGVSGVESAEVDLNNNTATVNLTGDVDDSQLKDAVEDAGYKATNII